VRISALTLAVVSLLAFSTPLHAQDQPQWVTELPSSDRDTYRAVATAETHAQATRTALAAIAEQVAVSVRSESLSVYDKQTSAQGTDTQSQFSLTVAGQSVPLQFSNIAPEQSYRHADGTVSVKVAVKKAAVHDFLKNQIDQYSELRFPTQADSQQQLLWLLRYKQPLQTANAYALALAQLDPSQTDNPFNQQLVELTRVEQSLGLRVIASRDLNVIAGVIQRNTPSQSQPDLWLQLEQQTQQRQSNTGYLHRQQLIASVTEPQSPFRQLHQQIIEVIGTGATPEDAATDAQNQLKAMVAQPVSNWLFDASIE
tara:strand:+ start:2522 stop:3460 length:939 start_codon:yes stop_codon:yes gene_type:complete